MVPKLRAGGREGQREGESVRGTGTKAQCWPRMRGAEARESRRSETRAERGALTEPVTGLPMRCLNTGSSQDLLYGTGSCSRQSVVT